MLGVHHPLVKSMRKAAQRGARTEDGFAIAEGFHLLHEALRAGSCIGAVLATPRAATQLGEISGVHLIDEAILSQISSVETSQGVVSLVRFESRSLQDTFTGNTLAIALDGVQDPGNAGAIVRSAEAFGATGVIFLKGSVSPWNPKTLRASAGSLFRLPFAVSDWEPFLQEVQSRELPLYAARPRASRRVDEIPLRETAAVLIGNEGRGLPPEHEQAAIPFQIPTRTVESLNAALAAGILLYEAARQRQ